MTFTPLLCTVALATPMPQGTPGNQIPVPQSQGMWTGGPVAVQIGPRDGTPTTDSVVNVRSSGIAEGTLAPWSEGRFGVAGAEFPDYSPEALFQHWAYVNAPSGTTWEDPATRPVLASMSSGGDVTPEVNAAGVLQMGSAAQPWYQISVALSYFAQGLPNTLVSEPNNPSGRIFSYCAIDSSDIDEEFIDSTRVEYTRQQIGLSGQPSKSISALDWGMGTISETPNGGTSLMRPHRSLFFFTLDEDWVQNHRTNAARPGFDAISTEVYYMQWNGAAWSMPSLAISETELFGTTLPPYPIDGLAVYADNAPQNAAADWIHRVVFSLDRSARTSTNDFVNPILVTQFPRTGTTIPAVEAAPLAVHDNGVDVKVSRKLGLVDEDSVTSGEPDDVKGVCGLDPDERMRVDPFVGTPTDWGGVPGEAPLGLSIFRRDGGNDTDDGTELLFQVHGIDHETFLYTGCRLEMDYLHVDHQGNIVSRFASDRTPEMLNTDPLDSFEHVAQIDESRLPSIPQNHRIELRIRAVQVGVLPNGDYDDEVGTSWTSAIRLGD